MESWLSAETLHQYLQSPWLTVGLIALLLAFAGLTLTKRLRKNGDQRRIKRAFSQYALAVEQNVAISDGIEGYLFADCLILLRGRMVALKVEPSRGYIFGGEKLEEWTSVKNHRTGKFRNPLVEVTRFARQLHETLGIEVAAFVLFGSDAEFPKGVPPGVLQMAHFADELDVLRGDESLHAAVEQQWARLMAQSRAARSELDAVLQS